MCDAVEGLRQVRGCKVGGVGVWKEGMCSAKVWEDKSVMLRFRFAFQRPNPLQPSRLWTDFKGTYESLSFSSSSSSYSVVFFLFTPARS